MQTDVKEEKQLLNTQVRDSGSKIIFDDNVLCSQFLNDYIDLPYVKDVKPEDIEDVSAQFVPLFSEERNADRVKKVHIKSKISFFFVSLIEHKTKVDYNVTMQIFRYMIHIWESYEKEMNQLHPGISKTVGFQYPPIIPIVYYEGKQEWKAPLNFRSRIVQGELFGKYVPDFTYYLIPLRDYSNERLLEQGDEISLVMLINKLQTKEDMEAFRKLPPEKINAILEDTPEYRIDIIANVLRAFLLKENVPDDEAEALVGKVKEKKMAELFEDMEPMDIQAERRNTRDAIEKGIRLVIEGYQNLGASKESAIIVIRENYDLSDEEVEEKMKQYWKE